MEREEVSAISLERRKQRLVRVMPHSHDLESRLCISLLPPMLPPAAWQLAAAEEEGWIMTLQTALALAQSLRDERRGDKYLFYFLTIYELGFGNLGHLVAVHLIYLHRSLFTILPDDDVLVVHSDCGVVSLYRGWCTVAVGFSKGEGWHHGSHHHYVFDIHNTLFYVVSYSY